MKKALKKTAARGSKTQPDKASLTIEEFLSEARALFLIIATTVLVYANSLSGAFVFDDTKQIAANPQLHSWRNIIHAFTSDVWDFQRGTLTADIPPPYYRPLFTAYLTLNYQLFGLWEPGWHLMNLLVHCAATVAVYYLLKRLCGDRIVATLAALLFGLHPAHVESVSWISGIPDPLAALFYVPSFLWYVRYREGGERKWLVASLLAYGLSALCKETPLVLPMVLCVWELTRVSRNQRKTLRVKDLIPLMVPYAVVGLMYLALRYSVLGRISWKHPFMANVPDSAIWMTVPFVLLNYLRHLAAPFFLSLIYGTSFITSSADPRFLVPTALLFGLACVLWVYRRKISGSMWVGIALTIAPLLPVLNLKVFHYEYIIQDRYLYLPSIGFCYLLALLIVRLAQRQSSLALVIGLVIAGVFGVATVFQNRVWHDPVALWQRAIQYAPSSWSTHYNLGLAYLGIKQNDLARAELLEAKRLKPDQANVYNNLALAQAASGDLDNAVTNVRTALSLDPRLLEAHNNLGAFLYDKGEFAEAKQEFLIVIQRDPSSASARFNLGRTLAALGDFKEAIRQFETVLAAQPEDREAHYQLGLSYAAAGRKADAIREIQRALNYPADENTMRTMKTRLDEIQQSQ